MVENPINRIHHLSIGAGFLPSTETSIWVLYPMVSEVMQIRQIPQSSWRRPESLKNHQWKWKTNLPTPIWQGLCEFIGKKNIYIIYIYIYIYIWVCLKNGVCPQMAIFGQEKWCIPQDFGAALLTNLNHGDEHGTNEDSDRPPNVSPMFACWMSLDDWGLQTQATRFP